MGDFEQTIMVRQAAAKDIPAVAEIFTECFRESVLHHCGGRMPRPLAMQDVFTLVYKAEPAAAWLACRGQDEIVGYSFAPARLSGLWKRALWEGHLVRWAWRWLSGQYGFGVYPLKIICLNKMAFVRSALCSSHTADARILSVAVKSSVQGQGIATQLMAAAMDYLNEQQVSRVRLEVRPNNKPAVRLYERLGFKAVGYTEDSQGQWLIMCKEMRHNHV